MIIMLLVCEIANQIAKSDEMPGNIQAAPSGVLLLVDALAHPQPRPETPNGGWSLRGWCARAGVALT